MNHSDKILEMASENNGIVTSSQVTKAGIPRHYLSKLETNHLLYKADRGIYVLPDAWEDEMYILQMRYSRGIFSHESALYLLNFTDRVPFKHTLTFPYGYHSQSIQNESVVVKHSIPALYKLGISKTMTAYNHPVQVYNIEKTLCDISRGQSTDIQIITDAMKRYLGSEQKNIPLLMDYAKKTHVENKIRRYVEALL
ncbi:hypothetical protein MmiHf6_09140 [Methanimicrococcus hongohii]|uniref:AbiEi antitoxin N-terminal domain-containing protein n=1 Tax=Methanimicrococcus hongohii TaxID=3028295 RepID=A0AA96V0B8_9EURY|nr:type IV toxin-antitoxin system AbiEi family antitoxin domain-containing protein [Methanimicrococcus sp. Hf6]WNY23605.1 hypothetical protein MmiHf6_09140 [Methanimicrococcus sp. Hf6]